MEVIFHKTLPDPPTKWVYERKKVKINKRGELVGDTTHYLTANLFYGDVHWVTRNTVVKFAKEWLVQFLTDIPELEKCQIEITYHHTSDGFDLDNKLYFWVKILLDILKTPSSRQEAKAIDYDNEIISIKCLKDDTVQYVDRINMDFKRGATALEIKIIGRKSAVQETLF
jgi:hypothetical protein